MSTEQKIHVIKRVLTGTVTDVELTPDGTDDGTPQRRGGRLLQVYWESAGGVTLTLFDDNNDLAYLSAQGFGPGTIATTISTAPTLTCDGVGGPLHITTTGASVGTVWAYILTT